MERSLSALLPVHNAQSTLAATVHEFLEILPELTRKFEVVIVDDGSNDATIEVADELAARYPQVVAIRRRQRRGRVAAVLDAVEHSTGEVLLVIDDDCKIPLHEVRRLWQAIDRHEIVVASVGTSPPVHRSVEDGRQPEPRGGFQMFTRRAIGVVMQCWSDETPLLPALAVQGLDWHEVVIPESGASQAAGQSPTPVPPACLATTDLSGQQSGSSTAHTGGPKRPNYLARLRDFALGE